MNKRFVSFIFASLFALSLLGLTSCEQYDPTEVKNPSITEENLLANPLGSTAILVTGVRRQFSIATGPVVYTSEIVSDNYDYVFVTLSPLLDRPASLTPLDLTINGLGGPYFTTQRLRALCDFGINQLSKLDANASNAQLSELYFYKGMALLFLAENFSNFPIQELGLPVTSAVALDSAVAQFNQSRALSTGFATLSRLAAARALRLRGNRAAAISEANAALAASNFSTATLQALYTEAILDNENNFFFFRSTANQTQPLPRLDFLDPKNTTQRGSTITMLKGEEAHLILAEAAISQGNLAEAREQMKRAITLAKSRATLTYTDRARRPSRPNNDTLLIKMSSNHTHSDTTLRFSGLIVARTAGRTLTTSPISNTSLDTNAINALPATSEREHFYTLYLLRQHIFFLEGRRMSDLGIRLPVMQRQIEGSPNMPDGSPGTRVVVPSYIPNNDEMDAFTINSTTGVVTITHDMNGVLANNRATVSPFTLP
ncbi:MAG: tetratricopeptide repeat protein [Chloroherpetonaceae bacterium]|nr:tetratricopeptide repeat protein [Chloroherpetonaceae bacterium]